MESGEMALAYAMQNMTHANFQTQVLAGTDLTSSGFGYMNLLMNCSNTLEEKQEKCSDATEEEAATGSKKEAVEVAKYHSEYQVASTEMNQKVGRQNALLNTEEVMEHLQSHDLVSVYSTMEYVSLVFLNTSSNISGFINR